MNDLVKLNDKEMMSTKRIAERTAKEHSNVLRDVRNMIFELEKSQDSNLNPNEYQEVKAKNGMTAEVLLNERLSLCLASGYSILLRMMIIDDWAEMKSKQQVPKSYAEALLEAGRIALALELETKEKEALQIELDKSKEWFTIKKVASQNNISWKSLEWKKLKSACKALGYETKKVFDANYEKGVNAYHYEAWKIVYPKFNYNFS